MHFGKTEWRRLLKRAQVILDDFKIRAVIRYLMLAFDLFILVAEECSEESRLEGKGSERRHQRIHQDHYCIK